MRNASDLLARLRAILAPVSSEAKPDPLLGLARSSFLRVLVIKTRRKSAYRATFLRRKENVYGDGDGLTCAHCSADIEDVQDQIFLMEHSNEVPCCSACTYNLQRRTNSFVGLEFDDLPGTFSWLRFMVEGGRRPWTRMLHEEKFARRSPDGSDGLEDLDCSYEPSRIIRPGECEDCGKPVKPGERYCPTDFKLYERRVARFNKRGGKQKSMSLAKKTLAELAEVRRSKRPRKKTLKSGSVVRTLPPELLSNDLTMMTCIRCGIFKKKDKYKYKPHEVASAAIVRLVDGTLLLKSLLRCVSCGMSKRVSYAPVPGSIMTALGPIELAP